MIETQEWKKNLLKLPSYEVNYDFSFLFDKAIIYTIKLRHHIDKLCVIIDRVMLSCFIRGDLINDIQTP